MPRVVGEGDCKVEVEGEDEGEGEVKAEGVKVLAALLQSPVLVRQ